jgi:hypothetical protein
LSKEKTIDLAKIVKNEQHLQKRVDSLQGILIQLNDSIQSASTKINQSISTIESLSSVISKQYNEIIGLKERQSASSVPQSANSLFGFVYPGTDFERLKSFDLGLMYVRPKTSYLFSVELFSFDKSQFKSPVFKFGFGYRFQ